MTTVLIIGSGAREHALAWKLKQSPLVTGVLVAPGNAGTAAFAENVDLAATDIDGLVALARRRDVGLTVIGPEAPLTLGLADALRAEGRLVVGPNAAAARLEASKSFAKECMVAAGIPTAKYEMFDRAADAIAWLSDADYPLVLKADGLAAGKGVVICADAAEARSVVEAFMLQGIHGTAGRRLLVEEALQGPEVSLLALVDGERAVPLPVAQDHKRLLDDDRGPNTGGMGAYAPYPGIDAAEATRLVQTLILPVVQLLREQGIEYRGVVFAGLMLTPAGPKVLEYNCRFGDPETQVILPLLQDDLYPWLEMTATGRLEGSPVIITGSAVGVVLASAGYPEHPVLGETINGLDEVASGLLVFHGGTKRRADGKVVTAGGRVVTVVGLGPDIASAMETAYRAPVHFSGMQRRRDIGRRIAIRWRHDHTAGRPRIVVLASGDGSNLQALIDACADETLAADIVAVVSHRRGAGALRRARDAGIPAVEVPWSGAGTQRRQYEMALLAMLAPYSADLLVLAGWMLILSAEFLHACACPVINVHPSLLEPAQFGLRHEQAIDSPPSASVATLALPAITTPQASRGTFPVIRGAHAVRDALALELPITGVTVHLVTPDVDAGPVILAETVPIIPGDSETSLYARIKPVEHRLLVRAIHSILDLDAIGGRHA